MSIVINRIQEEELLERALPDHLHHCTKSSQGQNYKLDGDCKINLHRNDDLVSCSSGALIPSDEQLSAGEHVIGNVFCVQNGGAVIASDEFTTMICACDMQVVAQRIAGQAVASARRCMIMGDVGWWRGRPRYRERERESKDKWMVMELRGEHTLDAPLPPWARCWPPKLSTSSAGRQLFWTLAAAGVPTPCWLACRREVCCRECWYQASVVMRGGVGEAALYSFLAPAIDQLAADCRAWWTEASCVVATANEHTAEAPVCRGLRSLAYRNSRNFPIPINDVPAFVQKRDEKPLWRYRSRSRQAAIELAASRIRREALLPWVRAASQRALRREDLELKRAQYRVPTPHCTLPCMNEMPFRLRGDFRVWELCRTMPLVGGFSRGSHVPPPGPYIPALLHTHLTSPSLALKTSMVNARNEKKSRAIWSSAGMKGGGEREIPRKPADQRHRPRRFPLRGVTPPGIEPGSPRWEASSLTAKPLLPPKITYFHDNRKIGHSAAELILLAQEISEACQTYSRPMSEVGQVLLREVCRPLVASVPRGDRKRVDPSVFPTAPQRCTAGTGARLPCRLRPRTTLGRSGRAVKLLASHQGEPSSIPGRLIPDFPKWKSCQTMPLVGGFSRGYPVYPPFHSGAAPFSSRFALIGSQDHDVKGRPTFFTHSMHIIIILESKTLRSAYCTDDNESTRTWFCCDRCYVIILRCVLGAAVTTHLSPRRAQFPARSNRDFRMWESCRTIPLVGGFSRGSPVSPAPSFRRRSIFTSITLIGSQNLDVKVATWLKEL
ncbi:hypothetical protein PR048_022990 [Dryococelus australis]|uniref:Uncharacterized protein n=1 Tax=Dryococelus australis TaxID=614101 RepID=A0ABQ9GSX5_9NEOP|nr:hypothetical protein PR048_022990 [Dryococelus australis]